MRIETRQLIAFIGLIFQLAPLFASAPEQQLANDYEAFFRANITQQKILGAAFVVVSSDRVIRIGTFGHTDTSKSRAINENTAFRVASVSKTFAAGLAGVLVTEGELQWDDPVTRYVPNFRVKGDSSQVKIRHLLGQSTGLMPHAYDNLIEDGVAMDRIQQQFSKLSYICSPGHCYSYQNSVFSLIEPVIEEATSQSYASLMEQKIFRPLDMKTASVGYEAFVSNPNHAEQHVLVRSGSWKTVKVLPNYYRVAPAAGVNASALDMGKWLMAQLGGHPEVLKPELIDTLTQPRVKTRREIYRRHWKHMLTEAHYGLGWRIYQLGEHRIAYHSGWVSGFRADVAWSEEHDLGFAILLNAESNGINELTTTFWSMAFSSLESAANPDKHKLLAATGQASP